MNNLSMYKRADEQDTAENTNTEFHKLLAPDFAVMHRTYSSHQGFWQEQYTSIWIYDTFSNTLPGGGFLIYLYKTS